MYASGTKSAGAFKSRLSMYVSGGNYLVNNSTWTKCCFYGLDYDGLGERYDWGFKPKQAGYYSVKFSLMYVETFTSNQTDAMVYKNGSEYKRHRRKVDNELPTIQVCFDCYLTPSDYLEFYAYQVSGSAKYLISGFRRNFIDIHRFA